jgi:putative colanic acid biosynthesis glycosyltransferase
VKIAQVDVDYDYSSTGKIVTDLVSVYTKSGHSSIAYYGRGRTSRCENAHRISSKSEVLLNVLGTRITGLTDALSPLSARHLIKQLERFKPDIVHLHEMHGYFVNIRLLVNYLRLKSIPTVWTFHSEYMYTGKCGQSYDCEKWKVECKKCPLLREYPKSWFFDFTRHMFHKKKSMFSDFEQLHLVAPSEWLASRMRQSMVKDKNISVVHNGLDIELFSRRDTGQLRASLGLTNEYVVLTVGSDLMSERKGGKWILELARRNPNLNIVFIMIGIKKLPQDIPDNVRMIPHIFDQSLLAEYYSLSNVLVLLSERETFSMVCAESLACGTPVIGFDAGAPKEVALPGFGEFVPYANLDDLESLLLKVQSGEISLKSSTECEQFARENYSKERMAKEYFSIYQQLLTRNSGEK